MSMERIQPRARHMMTQVESVIQNELAVVTKGMRNSESHLSQLRAVLAQSV